MTIRRRLGLGFAGLFMIALIGETVPPRLGLAPLGLVSEADARVGRPATPVSVAGVGRRTARRCVSGVYNC